MASRTEISPREIAASLAARRERIDRALDRLLPSGETWPQTLHQAVRHSVFAGGKRLRPILCLAAAEVFGAREEEVLEPACALEMIHTYSLIHDDLPALDNDDLRRGVPTCHVAFGEATAILAGDALLTHGLGTFAAVRQKSVDRKSTRLNSSHEWISYAVFCLKKKKITQQPSLARWQCTRISRNSWRGPCDASGMGQSH